MNSIYLTTPIVSALEFATLAHAGQTRKLSGAPYIQHPLQVAFKSAEMGYPEAVIQACLLHDVVEDCDVPLGKIADRFGFIVAGLVSLVTKPVAKPTAVELACYYLAIAADRHALVIKLLDRACNMSDMDRDFNQNPQWSTDYYAKTINEFVPLLSAVDGYHYLAVAEFSTRLQALGAKAKDWSAVSPDPSVLLNVLPTSLKSTILVN